MALIAVAAAKGAPGVTTTSLALSVAWPRPVLLAECDPGGGDLAAWLPAAGGGRLDPGRGLLSLAAAARRGLVPDEVWAHSQKVRGGLDVLAGVVTPEQGSGLGPLWAPLGRALAALPGADVIADCGRLDADGLHYDLLAASGAVILVTRAALSEVIRLRERAGALRAALAARGRPGVPVHVVVIAPRRRFHTDVTQVQRALRPGPGQVAGGLAFDTGSAAMLRGEWRPGLGRSLLVRTAREVARRLATSPGSVAAAPVRGGSELPSSARGRDPGPAAALPRGNRESASVATNGETGAGAPRATAVRR